MNLIYKAFPVPTFLSDSVLQFTKPKRKIPSNPVSLDKFVEAFQSYQFAFVGGDQLPIWFQTETKELEPERLFLSIFAKYDIFGKELEALSISNETYQKAFKAVGLDNLSHLDVFFRANETSPFFFGDFFLAFWKYASFFIALFVRYKPNKVFSPSSDQLALEHFIALKNARIELKNLEYSKRASTIYRFNLLLQEKLDPNPPRGFGDKEKTLIKFLLNVDQDTPFSFDDFLMEEEKNKLHEAYTLLFSIQERCVESVRHAGNIIVGQVNEKCQSHAKEKKVTGLTFTEFCLIQRMIEKKGELLPEEEQKQLGLTFNQTSQAFLALESKEDTTLTNKPLYQQTVVGLLQTKTDEPLSSLQLVVDQGQTNAISLPFSTVQTISPVLFQKIQEAGTVQQYIEQGLHLYAGALSHVTLVKHADTGLMSFHQSSLSENSISPALFQLSNTNTSVDTNRSKVQLAVPSGVSTSTSLCFEAKLPEDFNAPLQEFTEQLIVIKKYELLTSLEDASSSLTLASDVSHPEKVASAILKSLAPLNTVFLRHSGMSGKDVLCSFNNFRMLILSLLTTFSPDVQAIVEAKSLETFTEFMHFVEADASRGGEESLHLALEEMEMMSMVFEDYKDTDVTSDRVLTRKLKQEERKVFFENTWFATSFSQDLLSTYVKESEKGDALLLVRHSCVEYPEGKSKSLRDRSTLPPLELHCVLYVKLGTNLLPKDHPFFLQWYSEKEYTFKKYGVLCKKLVFKSAGSSFHGWFTDFPSLSFEDPLTLFAFLRKTLVRQLRVSLPLFAWWKKEWKPGDSRGVSLFSATNQCKTKPSKELYPVSSPYFLTEWAHLDPFQLIDFFDRQDTFQMNNLYLGIFLHPFQFVHPLADAYYVLLVEEFESIFLYEQFQDQTKEGSFSLFPERLKSKGLQVFHSELRVSKTLSTVRSYCCFVLFHGVDDKQYASSSFNTSLVSFFLSPDQQFPLDNLNDQVCSAIGYFKPIKTFHSLFGKTPPKSKPAAVVGSSSPWKVQGKETFLEIEKKQQFGNQTQKSFLSQLFPSLDSLMQHSELSLPFVFGVPTYELVLSLFLFGLSHKFLLTPSIRGPYQFDLFFLATRDQVCSIFQSKQLYEKLKSSVLFGSFPEDKFVVRVSCHVLLESKPSSERGSVPQASFYIHLKHADLFWGLSSEKVERKNVRFTQISHHSTLEGISSQTLFSDFVWHRPSFEGNSQTVVNYYPDLLQINELFLKSISQKNSSSYSPIQISFPPDFSQKLKHAFQDYCETTSTLLRFDSLQRLQSSFLANPQSNFQIPLSLLPFELSPYSSFQLKELLFQTQESL